MRESMPQYLRGPCMASAKARERWELDSVYVKNCHPRGTPGVVVVVLVGCVGGWSGRRGEPGRRLRCEHMVPFRVTVNWKSS